MIIILKKEINDVQTASIIKTIEEYGFTVHKSTGSEHIVLGAIGIKPEFDIRKIKMLDGVANVFRATEPYFLTGRTAHPENSIVRSGSVAFGGEKVVLISGPCAVESNEQIMRTASLVAKAGATVLRGGAFKPRSSPYSFQGLGEEGLAIMRKAANKNGLQMMTEVLESEQVDLVNEYTDIFQVGARNMHNSFLLKKLSTMSKPVLLKRAFSATIEEWLMAAEYILSGGNKNVILCERGIRTFDNNTRFTLDVSAIPVAKKKSHLPVIADPSHAAGISEFVPALARAAAAAGADGIMMEVHDEPVHALSDGPQSLKPDRFVEVVKQIKEIVKVLGRTM